jgi:hypothetical protein
MSSLSAGIATTSGIILTADTTGDVDLQSNGTSRLKILSDGRVYGSALHNNANAVTGTTTQYICSGTYTPAITKITNIAGTPGVYVCQYMRVGNVVTVSGGCDIQLTTTLLASQFLMTLPIASNFTTIKQGNGFCIGGTAQTQVWSGSSDIANDQISFISTGVVGTANNFYSFHFTYLIV